MAAFCFNATAQDYPDKPIRLIVPYAAGGVTDVNSRIAARKMSELLGQPIVAENRGGADRNIGTVAIARAAPDGYTIGIVSNGPMATNKVLYPDLPYDPEQDFTPITLLYSVPNLVIANPSLGAGNIQELIGILKADPGKYSYGHGGVGTSQHIAGARFASMAGLQVRPIGYKGEAPAIADILGGHVPFGITTYTSIGPHLQNGSLRVLAITSGNRSPILPDTPALAEVGLDNFDVQSWFGLAGPAGHAGRGVAQTPRRCCGQPCFGGGRQGHRQYRGHPRHQLARGVRPIHQQ
ncbi:tripartite tricarboxylate transporter substrate binding protein [Verticiella sediminum]|uniref:Tripartite tricarboxylate transporter substrate binding protein n=1 Tax=Verticiella sediminum TaxID=1247510 RepID=A0A556AJ16_9BURK|nr:tripartite tricarboxylate transporter substrate-binding protein [Verticiella sediminum]TSH92898.1 tripartite tricarboxylate transporter substrate binding protein [Verticiella sediminum]